MPATYEIDVARRLVISTVTGVIQGNDVVRHHKQLRRDPRFDPTFDQLADFTAVTRVDLTNEALRTAAMEAIFSDTSRRAMVAPNKEIYGMVRMYQTYRQLHGGRELIEIFATRDEAMRWLGRQ